MKTQQTRLQVKGLPRRTRNTFIVILLGILLVCCGLIFTSSNNNVKNETKVASINTLPPATATVKNEPTETYTSTVKPTDISTDTPTTVPTEVFTPIPTELTIGLNSCLPANAKVEKAIVTNVVDGDTIEVNLAGELLRVRYIGIDTPEVGVPFFQEATSRNTELVSGKDVILVKDVSETDTYNRLLRYVFVGNVFVNEVLVKEGYASANEYPPDTSCNSLFSLTQEEAKSHNTGLWQAASKAAPIVAATQPPTSDSGCPQGCLEQISGCDIKGNINADGEKIYHTPGSSSYSKTIITPSKGERWFCTADEAIANGWRAPIN